MSPIQRSPARKRLSPRLVLGVIGFLLLGFLAYRLFNPAQGSGEGAKPTGKGRGAMAVTVTTALVKRADIPLDLQAVGTIEASETVSIMPRVSGQLLRANFKQGDIVQKGQLLFEIDPSVYAASVAQAKSTVDQSMAGVRQAQASAQGALALVKNAQAAVHRDQAQANFATAEEFRYRSLLAQNFVTREQYTQFKANAESYQATIKADQAAVINARAQAQAAFAAVGTNEAGVEASRAALRAAQVQLDFTRIRSPLTGKTGPLLVYAGNIVQANTSSLVTITRLSPVRAVFTLPEKYLPSIQLAMTQQKLGVSAIMANDQGLSSVQDSEQQGKLIFVNNSVDTSSGTIQLKGEFPNTNQALWPGRFVKVKLDLGVEKNAIVLPSKAIQTGQNGDFVFGLAKGKKGLVAVMKPVTVSRLFDDRALLSSGVKVGDQIVVEGASFLQPGKLVTLSTGKRRQQTETAPR